MKTIMKIKATTPCYKFLNARPEEQVNKLLEEVEEAREAWTAFEKEGNNEALTALLMELLDVKACVNTALKQIECEVNELNTIYKNNAYEEWKNKANYLSMPPTTLFNDALCFDIIYREAKRKVINKNMARGYYAYEREDI